MLICVAVSDSHFGVSTCIISKVIFNVQAEEGLGMFAQKATLQGLASLFCRIMKLAQQKLVNVKGHCRSAKTAHYFVLFN